MGPLPPPLRGQTKSNLKKGDSKMAKCGAETEVYSRVTGYFRPVKNWNRGKREEFKDRKTYCSETSSKATSKEAVA